MAMDPKKWYMEHAAAYSLSDYYRDEEDELWSEMSPGFAEECNHVQEKESLEDLYDGIDPEDHSGQLLEFFTIEDRAEQGEAEAQFFMGLCCENGRGTGRSYRDAVRWFRKAARQGHVRAQLNLGCCYYNGTGVRRSYRDAAKWFGSAAEQGDSRAQMYLGDMYKDGYGVEKSYAEAARWYMLAAENDDPQPVAQCMLGMFYEQGLGVERSQEEADRWFALAVRNGCRIEDHYARRRRV